MTTIKPRTATVPIYQGDDLEIISDLRRQVDHAERVASEHKESGAPRRDGDEVPTADAEKAAYDAFVAEAAERAVAVVLRAIGRRRFRDLVADHPPRTIKDDEGKDVDHEDDVAFGVNAETFPMALLAFVDGDVHTVTEPGFSTNKKLVEFLDDELSDGDFEKLWTTAYFLNRAPGADPKASRYSTASPSLDATST